MALEEERTVSPETTAEVIKPKRSGIKYCCAACGVILLLIAVGILVIFLVVQRSCESTFKLPEFFQHSPSVTIPSGPWTHEDFSDLPEYVIMERYRDSLSIGVSSNTGQDDLEKLNRYLAQTYFMGFKVFNIAYFNKDNASELIAVYNYNSFSGTDNFTMMAPEPGQMFPAQ
jgi:hypothetical protein